MLRERYLHELRTESLLSGRIRALENGLPALLVLDMQNIFLESDSHAFIPSAPELVPRLVELSEAFESRELPVVFTRHTNTRENAGAMGRWWRRLISPEEHSSRVFESFDTSWGAVLEKHQYDAFHGTGLENLLLEQGVTAVVITGVMTHLCCESTARSAFIRGFDVIFPVDCTATYNIDLHRATTMNLSHGFCSPTCGKAVLRELKRVD